jgi:nucleoside-diphosphate-sugar epimerase
MFLLWNGSKLAESPNSGAFDPLSRPQVILLGLGFTTTRLARRLLCHRNVTVAGVARDPARHCGLADLGLTLHPYGSNAAAHLPKQAVIVHTIPPLFGQERELLRSIILAAQPRRVLYISSTSVYGDQLFVNSECDAAPSEAKGLHRVEEEAWLSAQPWSTLIVRPAAIYGPGRGVHVRIRERRPPRTSGSTVVSRIHVDDLAAILEAGIFSGMEGSWPCADDAPCSTEVISSWCAKLLNNSLISSVPSVTDNAPRAGGATLVSGRTVDGRKIRELLGIDLLYPGYQSGVLASIQEEELCP